MLRKWQRECVDLAVKRYSMGQHQFLCLATPGAGKTIMAAEVASELVNKGMVDGVLCFSPSITIARGIQQAFSKKLQCPFIGGMGDKGVSLTYQSLSSLNEDFWSSLKTMRLLVVFDEIHHCAGGEKPNAWGAALISKLQESAAFTMALTGTPWRSNASTIAFAAYTEEGTIHCDYTYGLAEAVADRVCRMPNIVVVDNEELICTNYDGSQDSYSSISDYLSDSGEAYGSLLNSESVISYVLTLASKKLAEIRHVTQDAAGLIVASSVRHAEEIAQMLWDKLQHPSVIVTYKHDNANDLIESFKTSTTPWIVSVGMISEGTDIPRLQVCCHLSRVKTELHFRQVLGRILRKRGEQDVEAWLYTLAEPKLVNYSEQLLMDVPESQLTFELFKRRLETYCQDIALAAESKSNADVDRTQYMDIVMEGTQADDIGWHGYQSRELLVLGNFKQRVISHFV